MVKYAWKRFLRRLGRYVVATEAFDQLLPYEQRQAGWLGNRAATERQIAAAEERLQVQFPPSYRQFLRVANGWSIATPWVHDVYPTAQVTYWRENAWAETITAWVDEFEHKKVSDAEYRVYPRNPMYVDQPLRPEYLKSAIQISGWTDGVFLLNPRTVTANGEWEAWFLSQWDMGATRYPSFWHLMRGERRRMVQWMRRARGRRHTTVFSLRSVAAAKYLLKKLAVADARVKRWALGELENVPMPGIVDRVLKLEADPKTSPATWCAVAAVLGSLQDPRAIDPLLARLRKHAGGKTLDDLAVSGGASHAIVLLGVIAPDRLNDALADRDPMVRKELVWSLSHSPRIPGWFDLVRARLTDRNQEVRLAAVRALINSVRSPQVQAEFKRMARSDRSADVRRWVRADLRRNSPAK